MTDETTPAVAPTATSPAPVTPAPAAAPAVESVGAAEQHCCSDHHHGAAPQPEATAAALPVANDCCSSTSPCSSDQKVDDTAAQAPEIDDAALIDALREVIDPELMINIVDLGLVYSINHTDRKVHVEMTLTSPACPAGPQIIMQSKMALEKLDGVETADIKLTMSPPWTPARMTDEARDQLGIF